MSVLSGSIHEAQLHINAWWRLSSYKHSKTRRGPDLRLGQYLWNMMGKDDCSFPELFYEESPEKAVKIVYDYFNNNALCSNLEQEN